MNDNLITCKRCGGNACYEQHLPDGNITWLCMGCGFTTSTLMEEGSPTVNTLVETSPELYKDLFYTDDTKKVWAPSTVTLPNQGMVFLNGTSKEDWVWSAVKAIPITEEDRKEKNFPADQTHKMDMQNMKAFEQKDFMDAMEYIGAFNVGSLD